jgi:hypothetical protein
LTLCATLPIPSVTIGASGLESGEANFYVKSKLAQDIKTAEVACTKNIFANPKIPKKLFMLAGDHKWITQAKQNHLTKKDLLARPLLSCQKGG